MKSTYQSTCPACGSSKAITSTDTEADKNRISEHTYCGNCAWCSCEHKDDALFVRPLQVEIPYNVVDSEGMIVRNGAVAFTEEEFNHFVQSIKPIKVAAVQPLDKPAVYFSLMMKALEEKASSNNSQDPLRAEIKRVEGLDD